MSGKTREPLTPRQQEVLDFISSSIRSRGYPPTLREIGEHLHIRSTNGVNDHLLALKKKGYLKRGNFKARALRPVNLPKIDPVIVRPKSMKSPLWSALQQVVAGVRKAEAKHGEFPEGDREGFEVVREEHKELEDELICNGVPLLRIDQQRVSEELCDLAVACVRWMEKRAK